MGVASEVRDSRQQEFAGDRFPALISGEALTSMDDACDWLDSRRDDLTHRLNSTGALLLRGFPVRSAGDFDRVVRVFDWPNFPYSDSLSNAVRRNMTERVFTANEAPADVAIYLHHEMAQTPVFPERLLFFCETAPDSGGATPLCRSDILLERLEVAAPDFVERCRALGLKYTNTMPEEDNAASGQGRSWRSTLGVADRVGAERRMRKLGYEWVWEPDGSLCATTPVLPAVILLSDGRESFFNQLIAAWRGWADAERSVTFGDGSRIEPEAMECAIRLSDSLSFDLEWETGDVAVVDNYRVMHGRLPFVGKRRVLASLAGRAQHH